MEILSETREREGKRQGHSGRGVWAGAVLILLIIPVTLWFFWRIGSRNYYLISVLFIFYTMATFFLAFEKRKPQAREMVVLAVLCALAVASRTAFIWVPHFKPMAGIIIIAGVAFGPEAGFLTGTISTFASGFIFGQGAWTPWQMFAFGAAGFLAGFLYRKGILPKKPLPLAVFGFLTIVLIVGPILDTSTFFMVGTSMGGAGAGAVYLSGLPVNLIHGTAVALTLLLVSRPMFEKLDRVRIKYGMMEGGL